jgi:hypothetical protein
MTNLTDFTFTQNEKNVLIAMLPHQDADFIPHGMSDINTIQNWVAHTGIDMSLRSITGIVGSLTKKNILFSEIMEERNGKKIYFSYHYFDQQPENLDILSEMVGLEIAAPEVKTPAIATTEKTNVNKLYFWNDIKIETIALMDAAGIESPESRKAILTIKRKETTCLNIVKQRGYSIETVVRRFESDKYVESMQTLKNPSYIGSTTMNHDWVAYCDKAEIATSYNLADALV